MGKSLPVDQLRYLLEENPFGLSFPYVVTCVAQWLGNFTRHMRHGFSMIDSVGMAIDAFMAFLLSL